MADKFWKDVAEENEQLRKQVEELREANEGLMFRVRVKDRSIAKLSKALELVHGTSDVIQVERPALVVVG